jgi:hypothetical protein
VFLPRTHERLNTFALLRVCRQIYAETALLPFIVNTFSALDCRNLRKSFKAFRKYQRSQITHLQIKVWGSAVRAPAYWFASSLKPDKFAVLPGLRRIKFQLFPDDKWKNKSFSETETFLRSIPEFALLANKYDIVVEKMDVTWLTLHRE